MKTNMTVYVVSPVDYYWYEPEAVFKSRKEAEAYIKANTSSDSDDDADSDYDEYQITPLNLKL